MSKEESVTTRIIKAFPNKKVLPQHSVLNYQMDLNFPKHKSFMQTGNTDYIYKNDFNRACFQHDMA